MVAKGKLGGGGHALQTFQLLPPKMFVFSGTLEIPLGRHAKARLQSILLMKHLFIIAFFALLSSSVFSQGFCGFDQLRQKLKETHRIAPGQENVLNETLLNHIMAQQTGRGGGEGLLVIPVVVHIIHQNGTENISDEQVQEGIADLNDGYANTGDYAQGEGIDIGIQFCLAQRDPDGNYSTGINRVQNALTNVYVPSDDEALKDLIRWNTQQYLNIWLVKEIIREEGNEGVVGYATFPDSHGSDIDGLVIEAAFFGYTNDGSKVAIHECGHYLGLYHTFEGGCTNNDCLNDGDHVCDTPPDAHVFNNFCFDGTNSCNTDDDDLSDNNPFRPAGLGGIGDQQDMQENYLDYSNLVCFRLFTPGQQERMLAAVLEVRASLLDGLQCVPPCLTPFAGDVAASATTILAGESVTFANNSTGFNMVHWFLDDEEVATTSNYVFSTTQQGVYEILVEMMNDEPGCSQTFQFIITVICPIDVSFSASTTSLPEGGVVQFENESTGADSYTWYVDATAESTSENFSFAFDGAGGHTVYLEATNGICTVQSPPLYISVGSCTSGRENNLWHWFNLGGNGYGFNFNDEPVSFIQQNNLPPNIAHCKTTLCDEAGNLLFISTGEQVLDKNYDVMPNGNDLMGHISAHFGTLIIKKPASDHEYYLFTAGDQDSFDLGLRYSIIDGNLNNGLGDVTDVKNIFIEETHNEGFACVRHCNLEHFWLVFYDLEEDVFKSYLVDDAGIASTPVVTDPNITVQNIAFSNVLRVSPKGDRLVFVNHLLDIDATTGEVALVHSFDFDLTINYDFSSNGQYLYYTTGNFDVWLRQYDISVPAEEIEATGQALEFSSLDIYGKDMKLAPDGKIYLEESVSGYISVINNPNAQFSDINFVNNAIDAQALINSFGNFYHAYISGKTIWIEGEDEGCVGEEKHYNVYGQACLPGEVAWQVLGSTNWEEDDEGILLLFDEEGEITIVAEIQTACGIVSDSLHITITNAPELNLGPDMNICFGDLITFDAGSGWDEYLWQDGSTGQTFTTSNTGTFAVTATLGNCEVTDEIVIENFISSFLNLGEDFDMCDNEVVVLDASNFAECVWQDGSQTPTYTVFEGGTYWVTCTLPCFATDTVYVDDCNQTIGLEEISEHGISLYPNPNHGEFSVHWNNSFGEIMHVEILDANGKLVERILLTGLSNSITADVRHLDRAFYTLRLVGTNRISEMKLVLIE